MNPVLPSHGRQIRSTLEADGTLVLDVADVPLIPPGNQDVVIAMEAVPANPSDIMTLLASADPNQAQFGKGQVVARVNANALATRKGRFGLPLAIGLTGAGTVIAAGGGAQHLIGRHVTTLCLSRGTFGEYLTAPAACCAALPEGIGSAQAADVFCNPMTVMAMIEEVRLAGQDALIHTAAASNLGQMLVKACREDGLKLVNIVRRDEQAELLRGIGAEHVVNASEPDFFEQLCKALSITGARIAFDAIGGGAMADTLLRAMEQADVTDTEHYNPYGSDIAKVVHIYGFLDTGQTTLSHEHYGMRWTVDLWSQGTVLSRISPERIAELTGRVMAGINDTFSSRYAHTVSLDQVLDRDVLTGIARHSTGRKYLIDPRL